VQGVYPLTGKVQHYSWGGTRLIPQLLGIENEKGLPFAEYWLGAHPNFPSTIDVAGRQEPLNRFLADGGGAVLGTGVREQFGSLPYLFKVLDVAQMLSIQVHPSLAEARKGFDAENAAGIPLTAAHRNYKDANHKPEQMVALGDFYLLHGFKAVNKLVPELASVPELAFLAPILQEEGYQKVYATVMTMEQDAVNRVWHPIAERLIPLYEEGSLQKTQPHFWAARAMATFCRNGSYDRGLFSIYLLNLVKLQRGEGVFQPEGMPHAYLEGQNIEVMANSDNVLRGGLTDKHVDVPELLRHTNFVATNPQVLHADENGRYFSGAREFVLTRGGSPFPNRKYTTTAAEIVLVLAGQLFIKGSMPSKLSAGGAALIAAGQEVELDFTGETEFYTVTVPRA
jgi:mannose-6-phosphate isomerase